MNETMRIVICERPEHIEVRTREIPGIGPGKVLVRVVLCGICASDIAVWQGRSHKQYPYSPGHEFCGIIEGIGSNVTGLKKGQRVVIDPNFGCGECRYCRTGKPNLCDFLKNRNSKSNGGMSDYVALESRMVYALPEELPDELAPFIEPLSCALHISRSVKADPREIVVVFGAGIIGVMTGIVLRESGIKAVFVEPSDHRRDQVATILPVPVMTPSEFADSRLNGQIDAAIECSGNAKALDQAIRGLCKAGRLILPSLVKDKEGLDMPLMDITCRELEIKGVWLNPYTFSQAIDLAVKRTDTLGLLKTETFGLENTKKAFKRALCPEVHKVFIRP